MPELSFPPMVRRWLTFLPLVFGHGLTPVCGDKMFFASNVANTIPLACSLLGLALPVCLAPLATHRVISSFLSLVLIFLIIDAPWTHLVYTLACGYVRNYLCGSL